MYCQQILNHLGITSNYIGFRQTLYAVSLVQQEPNLLFLVTKELYPAVAKEYGTTWKAVERNIRSVISMAWARNPDLLRSLAGYDMDAKPKAAQFIAILVDSERRQRNKPISFGSPCQGRDLYEASGQTVSAPIR